MPRSHRIRNRLWLMPLLCVLACRSGGLANRTAPEAGVSTGPTAPSDAASPTVDGPRGLTVIDAHYVERHFTDLLVGTWLVGWPGGMDHFSWLRISAEPGATFGGAIQVLADPNLPRTGVPYWPCSGPGRWGLTQRPATLDLNVMPAGCPREIMVFETVRAVNSPGRAFLEAQITSATVLKTGYGEDTALIGYKFPDDMCNADFSVCATPYGP